MANEKSKLDRKNGVEKETCILIKKRNESLNLSFDISGNLVCLFIYVLNYRQAKKWVRDEMCYCPLQIMAACASLATQITQLNYLTLNMTRMYDEKC